MAVFHDLPSGRIAVATARAGIAMNPAQPLSVGGGSAPWASGGYDWGGSSSLPEDLDQRQARFHAEERCKAQCEAEGYGYKFSKSDNWWEACSCIDKGVDIGPGEEDPTGDDNPKPEGGTGGRTATV